MKRLGQVDFVKPGSVQGVTVSGNYAYAAEEFGLRVIDVSNPAAPQEVNPYDMPMYARCTSTYARSVAVDGRLIFVADVSGSLFIWQWNP